MEFIRRLIWWIPINAFETGGIVAGVGPVLVWTRRSWGGLFTVLLPMQTEGTEHVRLVAAMY